MMWELIRQNRRKSMMLFVIMALLLVLLGFFIGNVFDPERGGVIGLIVAVGIWLGLTAVSLGSASGILLKVSGAREVTRDVHPRLFNVVEEMKIAAGLPAMPKVYIIDDPSPNALAIGISPDKSAVAVTAGLLSRLNRDELQGVIAHEVAHIVNRDSQLMTVAGIMLGSIVLLSQVFLRSWWFMPSSSRRYRSKSPSGGNPQLQLVLVIVAIALAILAPIFARLLYLAISRKREYLADATAVQFTRYPEGLASALEKIAAPRIPLESANQVTAPMYIHSPLLKKGQKVSSLASTHPPIEDRIKILRYMSRGADYYMYQRAFSKLKGKPTSLIPASHLDKQSRIEIRQPDPDAGKGTEGKTGMREVGDLMRAVNDYAFIACLCGLRMKLPPDLPEKKVACPKCGRENEVPTAELAVIAAMAGAAGEMSESPEPVATSRSGSDALEYKRKGTGWESFSCACGKLLQISPAFSVPHLSCKKCGRITYIK